MDRRPSLEGYRGTVPAVSSVQTELWVHHSTHPPPPQQSYHIPDMSTSPLPSPRVQWHATNSMGMRSTTPPGNMSAPSPTTHNSWYSSYPTNRHSNTSPSMARLNTMEAPIRSPFNYTPTSTNSPNWTRPHYISSSNLHPGTSPTWRSEAEVGHPNESIPYPNLAPHETHPSRSGERRLQWALSQLGEVREEVRPLVERCALILLQAGQTNLNDTHPQHPKWQRWERSMDGIQHRLADLIEQLGNSESSSQWPDLAERNELNADRDALRWEDNSLLSKISRLEKELQDKERALQKAKSCLKIMSDVLERKERIHEVNDALKEREIKAAAIRDVIRSIRDGGPVIINQDGSPKQHEGLLITVHQMMERHEQETKEIKTLLEKKSEENFSISQELSSLQNALKQAMEDVSRRDHHLLDLEKGIAVREQELSGLRNKLRKSEEALSNCRLEGHRMQTEINKLKMSLRLKEEQTHRNIQSNDSDVFERLQQELHLSLHPNLEREGQIRTLEEEVHGLRRQLEIRESGIKQLEFQIGELNNKISDTTARQQSFLDDVRSLFRVNPEQYHNLYLVMCKWGYPP